MSFDIAGVARELDRLLAHPHVHKLALVLPLDPGKRDVAREYLGADRLRLARRRLTVEQPRPARGHLAGWLPRDIPSTLRVME